MDASANHELELCRELIAAADEHRYRHPEQALRRALAARDLATSFDVEQLGESAWRALQVRAWAVAGSAYRVTGDLLRAENCLNVALALSDGQPMTDADLAQRAAYLRCDQRRFDEALELNGEALASFERGGDAQRAAGTLVDRALIVRRSGHSAAALPFLVEALDKLDRQAVPRTWLAAVHNLALYLHETAASPPQHAEALRWLELAIAAHSDLPEPINVLKLRQMAALSAIGLGHLDEGRDELTAVAESFAELGAAEEIVPLLHLARLAVAQDDIAAVRRLAGRLFPLLRRLEPGEQPYTVLVSLLDAAQGAVATVELVQQAIDQVSAKL